MNTLWIENARRAFAAVYGEKKGSTVCDVVIPSVLRDFRSMLARAEPGVLVTEDYRTDDKRTEVHLEGRREPAGAQQAPVVTRLTVGGGEVDLGSAPLRLP